MAGKMNVVMLMVMVVAFMQLQDSKAQTSHVVGGSIGWNVPSAGPSAYSTWASSQTFTVGDLLVFNFPTGAHNVAEVTRSGFDACNGTSPISMNVNGPANITLPAVGTRYFICTVGTHCTLGQRLAINISAATTSPPAAQPATPPSATPTPVSPPPSATPAPVSPRPSAPPAPVSPPPSTPVSPPGTIPAPSSPGGGNAPPPPNSGISVAVTALPVALFSIALAFLY